MGPAAGKLYFDLGISLSTTAAASNNDPTTATASYAAGLRGSILPVPVIAAAIRSLPVTAVVVPSVVLQPAVFAIEGSRQLMFQQYPVSPVQVGGKTFFGPCALGVLGICDIMTTTTTCSFELYLSDKESLKINRGFRRPDNMTEEEIDAAGDGDILVIMDLRPDESLFEAGVAREVVIESTSYERKLPLNRLMVEVYFQVVG
ncbi:hypothetical protein RHSIM_Rhsim05G0100100 [Rhododendron simsii]|uniref:Uncharacterized protein n=1 Tax=Rhododendron simsii TaxID=118357 RepID=A0A834LMT8_RHOSS|nr:hypothetical protein RHSIM_Rhsim05G0100100 [Rhododendron simsii]